MTETLRPTETPITSQIKIGTPVLLKITPGDPPPEFIGSVTGFRDDRIEITTGGVTSFIERKAFRLDGGTLVAEITQPRRPEHVDLQTLIKATGSRANKMMQ
ncbi:MAG: hypothetical protein WC651_00100 [Candidatus Gracilibacteria bacterium]|jgi:hypothetical protein